ncbi:MAG TPA: endo-1,4-beta-xylanase [Caulobacteraceae bacterium]|nr:endo-1,4-beta-xylanase [Caulobacteraceae bacterium]
MAARTLLDRRGLIAGALALAGCARASVAAAPRGDPPALKAIAPSPVGCCVTTDHLDDPAFAALFLKHFSQLTAEWEMKMEAILGPDGTMDFGPADRLADFARNHRLRLFGTTLIWGEQKPAAFRRLDGDRPAFAKAYGDYIAAVVGRYRGQTVGWDVVNEPILPQGGGLQENLWSRNLGTEDHMLLAFRHAAEADPAAVLVLNDYNLENVPAKRADFLRLAERLMKRGAPIGALGSQSHIDLDTTDAAIAEAYVDLASLGLPIHISELDLSLGRRRRLGADLAERRAMQARRAGALARAWRALPDRQRFAFTVWGLRDRDSWLRGPGGGDGSDEPVLFDDSGRAKADFWAVADAFAA